MKPVERCEKMCQRLSWIEAILIIDMNIVERTLRKAFYFARKLWAKYFTSFLPCPAIDMRQNVNGNLVVFTLGIFPQCEARTYDKYMANGRWATKKLIYSVFFFFFSGWLFRLLVNSFIISLSLSFVVFMYTDLCIFLNRLCIQFFFHSLTIFLTLEKLTSIHIRLYFLYIFYCRTVRVM